MITLYICQFKSSMALYLSTDIHIGKISTEKCRLKCKQTISNLNLKCQQTLLSLLRECIAYIYTERDYTI